MPPFLQFIPLRFLAIPVSFIIITMVLYSGVMLTPPETRATLYMPNPPARLSQEQIARLFENV